MNLLTPENSLPPEQLEILLPGQEKSDLEGFYVVTDKYGETRSELKSGFEKGVEKHEGEYFVEAPDEVIQICEEISKLGGRALLVGGSVRDTVISKEHPEMHLKPKDFDLEIYGLSPEFVQRLLETNFDNQKIDKVGRAFGIIKVYIDGWDEPLDFSIPRRESKKGIGHKGFETQSDSTMTIDEASTRRDLTINSLAYDPLTHILYDAYGGIRDIKNKEINVTDSEAFKEDPLRVLRVVQFASRFNFKVTQQTVDICKAMVYEGQMDELPREREEEEVKKLFEKGIRPSVGLEFAKEVGFIQRYWPEVNALIGVPQEKDWHPEGDVWVHTLQVVDAAVEVADREIRLGKLDKDEKLVLVLGALCHDLGKPSTTQFIEGAYRARGHEQAGVDPSREFLMRIFGDPKSKLTPELIQKILPLVADHLKPKTLWETEVRGDRKGRTHDQTSAIRRLARRLSEGDVKSYPDGGGSNIYMLSLIAEADQRGRNGESNSVLAREAVPELEAWQSWLLDKARELKVDREAPTKLIGGKELMQELEVKAGGSWLGAILEAVYLDQLEGTVTDVGSALASGAAYFETIGQKVRLEAAETGIQERVIWDRVRHMEDPRIYLQTAEA